MSKILDRLKDAEAQRKRVLAERNGGPQLETRAPVPDHQAERAEVERKTAGLAAARADADAQAARLAKKRKEVEARVAREIRERQRAETKALAQAAARMKAEERGEENAEHVPSSERRPWKSSVVALAAAFGIGFLVSQNFPRKEAPTVEARLAAVGFALKLDRDMEGFAARLTAAGRK